jgi:gluconate 2-dehydrogenase gamma chain
VVRDAAPVLLRLAPGIFAAIIEPLGFCHDATGATVRANRPGRGGEVNRRELLQAAIGSGTGIAFLGLQRACLAAADLDAAPANIVLDDDEREILAAVAETIIPATDTPGAIDADVPQFVELILSDWHTAEERQPVLEGLVELDRDCQAAYGKGFAACTPAEQAEALAAVEDGTMFKMMKSLVVNAYFTSEVGVNAQSGYNPMPGVYKELVLDATTGRWA